tara:strand:+ start:1960 stop:2205 length:246 start_codon:yes stop_codon:yes gene_type:complete
MPLLSLTTLNTVELEKIYNKKKTKKQTTSNIKHQTKKHQTKKHQTKINKALEYHMDNNQPPLLKQHHDGQPGCTRHGIKYK